MAMKIEKCENMNNRGYIRVVSGAPGDNIYLGYEYEKQYGPDSSSKRNEGTAKKTKPKDLPEGFNVSWDPIWGGLGQWGWEVRSCVATLKFHKVFWKKILAQNDMSQWPNVENGAGIHVHIENNERTRANISKVYEFLHTTDRVKLQKISGRSQNLFDQNCRQTREPFKTPKARLRTHETFKNNTHGELPYDLMGHYGIINSESEKTYECRLFGAQPDLLIPALEAMDSLVHLSEQVDTIDFEKWDNYTKRFRKYGGINARLQLAA